MMNHIDLMGRLTRDPELRYTQSEKAVASFSLAVDRDYQKDAVDFIDVVAWNKTAEFVSKYFSKGQLVAVSGRLQMRDWTDKNGNKRTSAEVVAENVYFAEKKKEPAPLPSSVAVKYEESSTPLGGFVELEEDGELPF